MKTFAIVVFMAMALIVSPVLACSGENCGGTNFDVGIGIKDSVSTDSSSFSKATVGDVKATVGDVKATVGDVKATGGSVGNTTATGGSVGNTTATGGSVGNTTATGGNQKQTALGGNSATTITSISEDKREHISALPGTVGSFVLAPFGAMLDGWKAFVCQPLFSVFTKERLNSLSSSGSFSDKKGGFLHRLFSSPIKKVIHVPFNGTQDDKPVVVLNWDSSVIYPQDQLLGEFECEGYYGWPRGAALGRCLAEAKAITNTSRVFAYYRVRRDPKNSGFSIGSGAAGSALGGAGGDKLAGAMSLGGLIGTTSAYVDEAVDWTVLALNDGPTTPPNGMLVCGQLPPSPAQSTPPPAVEKPKEPEKPACSRERLLKKIELREEEFCPNLAYKNFIRNLDIADLDIEEFVCTNDLSFLEETYIVEKTGTSFSGAKGHFRRAEMSYLNIQGKLARKEDKEEIFDQKRYKSDPAFRQLIDGKMVEAYRKWMVCIRILEGPDAELSFLNDQYDGKKRNLRSLGINGLPKDFVID